MNEIVLATGNRHKVEEIRRILKPRGYALRTLDEFPGVPEVVEDGKTIEENAAKKARVIARHLKKWALADDSGLEVDHLGGEPGVYSARWAGPGCTYDDNNRRLLDEMRGVPPSHRSACFRTVIALSDPRGRVRTVEGVIRGRIALKARGRNGFGYDPVFVEPRSGKTFAELPSDAKNRISHRGRALREAKKLLRNMMDKS